MTVRQLFPPPAGVVDLHRLYGNADRTPPPRRPYVVVNMVASIDGATEVGGITKPLGSSTDRAVFHHLRDVADGILVGAATVRIEKYGPARPTLETQSTRRECGQLPIPPIIVVTRSIEFDWESPFFASSHPRPILLVPGSADPKKRERAALHADVVPCGDQTVDLLAAMEILRNRGINTLLCEGGPLLNTELLNAGLIDELCLTVAPLLVGGPHARGIFAGSNVDTFLSLRVTHVLEDDSFLYLRYHTK